VERLLIRWLINAAAIWAAFELVPGIHPTSRSLETVLGLALIFGLLNAVVRPVLKLLTCPFLILTLGLGILLLNAFMFWLTGWVGSAFDVGFRVDGFGPAFWGALIVSLTSWILNTFLGTGKHERDQESA
jgi:putative membrane protein